MKTLYPAKIRKELSKTLEPKRFEHTLGVAYTAANLAAVHGEDIDRALLAGLLHDCAKCMSDKKQKNLCRKNHMPLSDLEKGSDVFCPTLHAKAGAALAKEKYGVTDEDILNAILYHTTGRPRMSTLEKIIYIADYIEPTRKHLKGTMQAKGGKDFSAIMRQSAFRDLDEALLLILKNTLDYLHKKKIDLDPMTQLTYDYYMEQKERKQQLQQE